MSAPTTPQTPPARHRLFHTLVLSGAALAGGCATTPAPPPPAPPPRDTAATSAAGDARGGEVRDELPTDEAAVVAMLRDARVCGEVGWPTTKSASALMRSVMRAERQYFCLLPQGMARYPGRPRCCELLPQP
ncbi:MAG: hypothetical protein U0325_21685 [Polyangiales bacterium]